MAKTRKPMRLEDSLIKLVEENGKGETFTSKMEYILYEYFKSIPTRKAQLDQINEMIASQQKKYDKRNEQIKAQYSEFEKFTRHLFYDR